MRQLDLTSLSSNSAAAAVASSCRIRPDFLLTSQRDNGLSVARWRADGAMLPEVRRLSDHLLWYCAAGAADARLTIGGEVKHKRLGPGSMGFVPAGTEVQWTLVAATDTVFVNISLPRDALRLQGGAGASPHRTRTSEVCDSWVGSYFGLLIAECEQCLRAGTVQASSFLDETAGLLIRHLEPLISACDPPCAQGGGQDCRVTPLRPFLLRKIDAFIDSHLESDIRLESLAAMASMSVGHFVRAFRRATNSPPHQYLVSRRLERACLHLRESTERVSAIARRCGFSSPAHFAAIFRARHGCSPSSFRRQA